MSASALAAQAPRPVQTDLGLAVAPSPIEAVDVRREFRGVVALDGVSLAVPAGQVHALLGPNGAGKTTLLRILSGLLVPSSGSIRVLGAEIVGGGRALRARVGIVPSGDRSFYLRISAFENLVFFARLHGLRRGPAQALARDALERVGLSDAADRPVALLSHGMQKRLSIARALLADPAVLLVDEATHDLDPEGATRVRELVARAAGDGAAVLWATQRLDEIRGFADRVTLLASGRARFAGSVPRLLEHSIPRTYVLRVEDGAGDRGGLGRRLAEALAGLAQASPAGPDDPENVVVTLRDGVELGDAVAALVHARVRVLTCRQERSDIEEAFLSLTREEAK